MAAKVPPDIAADLEARGYTVTPRTQFKRLPPTADPRVLGVRLPKRHRSPRKVFSPSIYDESAV